MDVNSTDFICPDKWVVLKIDNLFKVMGTWAGGYLYGDSWKLNSGIKKVTEDENHWYFEGFSGSVYKCNKQSYGTTAYGASLIHSWQQNSIEHNTTIEVLKNTYDFNSINHYV